MTRRELYLPQTYPIVVLDTASHKEVELPSEIQNFPVKWLDNNILVYATPLEGLKLHDVAANKTTKLHSFDAQSWLETLQVAVSPLGHFLSWSDPYNYSCPKPSYLIAASLLNLTGSLSVVNGSQNVALRGTAMDAHLGGWRLEYAEANEPDSWNLVVPVSDASVIDDLFATWLPPSVGTFHVRLTVWDKAGNVSVSKQTVSWGVTSNITKLYKSQEVISPNGDGVRDTVEIFYELLAPAPVNFTVHDKNNAVVNIGLASSGAENVSWDGRDGEGRVVPDGKYKIRALDNDFEVEVDNTAPDVRIDFGRINPHPNEYGMLTVVDLTGHVIDKHLKDWIVEYGEGDNPQEWHEHLRGGYSVGKKDTSLMM